MAGKIQTIIDQLMQKPSQEVKNFLSTLSDDKLQNLWAEIQAGDGPSELSGPVEAELRNRNLLEGVNITMSDAKKFLEGEESVEDFLNDEKSSQKTEGRVDPPRRPAGIGSAGLFIKNINNAVREVAKEFSDDLELHGHDPEKFGDYSVILQSGDLSSVKVIVDIHNVAGNLINNREVVDILADNGIDRPDDYFETRNGNLRLEWEFD